MNMFARFDENPAMTLQDIKKTKCYGRTDAHTDAGTHTHAHTDNVKTVYPPTTKKFVGGIIDRPMKAPSIHIQKPYWGKLSKFSIHIQKPYWGKIV